MRSIPVSFFSGGILSARRKANTSKKKKKLERSRRKLCYYLTSSFPPGIFTLRTHRKLTKHYRLCLAPSLLFINLAREKLVSIWLRQSVIMAISSPSPEYFVNASIYRRFAELAPESSKVLACSWSMACSLR